MEAGTPAEGGRGISGETRDCVEEDGSRRGRRVLEESSMRASLGEGAGGAAALESRRALVWKTLGIRGRGRKKRCGRLRPGRGRDAGWRRRRWDGIVVDAGREGQVRPVVERDNHSFETKWLERGMCEQNRSTSLECEKNCTSTGELRMARFSITHASCYQSSYGHKPSFPFWVCSRARKLFRGEEQRPTTPVLVHAATRG